MTNSDINKKKMVEALKASLGIIKTACEEVGISRQTHYRWLEEDADYKQQCEDIGEEAIDFVESKLMEKVNGVFVETKEEGEDGNAVIYKQPPSDTAIIFYLKTKGKKRGYIERQELDHMNPVPVNWQESKTYETKSNE